MRWVNSLDVFFPNDVAVGGQRAYVASGVRSGTPANGISVVDVSDPLVPIQVGRVDIDEPALAVALLENHAVLAAGIDGVVVVDLGPPMRIASSIRVPGFAVDVATDGSMAYVACRDSGLAVVDVTSPASPILAGQLDTSGYAWTVLVDEGKVYLADGYEGIKIIDVSNPGLPEVLGSLDLGENTGGLALNGHVLNVTDSFGLALIDVSDASKPVVIGRTPTPGGAGAVASDGHTTFVGSGYPDGGLLTFDVTNPSTPALLGTTGPSEVFRSLTLADGRVYAVPRSLFGDVQIVDVSHPTSPSVFGKVDSLFSGVAVSISGDQALMVSEGFLYNIDVSASSTPTVTGWVYLEYPATDIDAVGSYAYVAEGTYISPGAGPTIGTLQIFNVSAPGAPVEVTSIPGFASGVEVVDSLAFVAKGRLVVLDVTDPASPIVLNDDATPGINAQQVAVAGGWAYVLGSEMQGYGLYVVDVSDPAFAHVTGSCQGYGEAVAVAGRVVCTVGYKSMQTFDVSDPQHPLPLTYVPIPATFGPKVSIADGHAYVGTSVGVMVFDLSRPDEPVLIGQAPVTMGASGVALANGLVYAGGGRGLSIHPIQCPGLDPVDFGALEIWPVKEGIYIRWESHPNLFTSFLIDRALGIKPSGDEFIVLNPHQPVRGDGPWEFLDREVSSGRSYSYKIRGERRDGGEETIGPVVATAGALSAPRRAALRAAPNPASSAVTLRFELTSRSPVELAIYDATGHLVRRLSAASMEAGSQTMTWDGRNGGGQPVASGRYVAKLSRSGGAESTGIVLLRD